MNNYVLIFFFRNFRLSMEFISVGDGWAASQGRNQDFAMEGGGEHKIKKL